MKKTTTKKILDSSKVLDSKNKNIGIENAIIALEHTKKTINSLYEIYQNARAGSAGVTSHNDQDLLRAILVFSCSGLDAVVKQLIKGALPEVINKSEGAQLEFESFTKRVLGRKNSKTLDDSVSIDIALLSKLLTTGNSKDHLLRLLVRQLTDNSLQSEEQLLKIAAHFALTRKEVLSEPDITKEAFRARNEIIHEMDSNFEVIGKGIKKRHQRAESTVVKQSENVLMIAVSFICSVQQILDQS